MAGGRPPIWDDPKAFDKAADEYFANEKQPTWTGLAIHLGFESRQSLEDYKKKPEFSYSIKKALLKVENQYEKGISKGNPAGSIFALKNFGWRDKQEFEQSGGIKFTFAEPDEYQKLYPSEDKGNIGESDSVQ